MAASKSKLAGDRVVRDHRSWTTLIDSIPLAAWIHDPESDRLLDANDVATAVYGFSRDEFRAMTLKGLQIDEDSGRADDDSAIEIQRDAVGQRTRSGKEIWVMLFSKELDGANTGLRFVTALDVTDKRRLFETMRVREEQLSKLIDRSADIIYETDSRGRFTFVNLAVRSLLGFEPREVIGRHYTELIREDWRTVVMDHYRNPSRAPGLPTYFEFPAVASDGKVVWIGQSVTPVLRKGSVTGFQAIARDITQRRVAEERFNTFMNNSPTTSFIKQADGVYVYVNELMNRHFAAPGTSLVGRADVDLMPAEILAGVRAVDEEVLRSGKAIQVLENVPTIDGGERQWLTYKFPVSADDGTTFVGGVAVDLTDRLSLERDLASARDTALESARLKSEFLANMSHEIRTPMNGVIGLLGVLLDTELNDDQKDLASTARSSAESLLTIINDILDFSKIEAGKLDFEVLEFDVRKACESTIDLLADSAHKKSLEIGYVVDPDIPAVLRGDSGRLRQILLNIIGNAIKFTTRGGVLVQIEREADVDENVVLRFRITDTGDGIDEATRKKLFQPFTQSDASTTRRFGGTGLGLAISKQLVHLMGGEIGVESEPGCGATFWFTATFACSDRSPAMVMTTSSPRVLVVEDSTTTRQMVSLQLTGWHVPNDAAADGFSAMSMMREQASAGTPYDVVITDVQMHQLDGISLARLAHGKSEFGKPRFVLMTAGTQSIDAAKLADIGVATCLRKPVRQEHLFSAVFGKTMRPVVPAPVDKPAARRSGNRRILVVDDNAVNQKVALRQLQKLGVHADAVGNGLEAIEALDRIAYDLVLMDCQMPEMDGYEATRLLRARGTMTPVIALTASASDSDRDKCLRAGMNDFLPKPVREGELGTMIERWLPTKKG
jgi:two-component system sensor histidine kinase/response regulator